MAALAALLALPFAACDCADDTVGQAPALIGVSPDALTWGDVCADSSTVKTLTITNKGRSTLNATLAIEGDEASFFSLDKEAIAIDFAGGTAEVKVTFHPNADALGTDHDAQLVITSNGSEQPLKIRLSGDVANVAPEPILSFRCADSLPLCKDAGREACCFTARNFDFGQPVFDQEVSTVLATVSNLGCGNLEVTDVRIETLIADNCQAYAPEGGGAPVEQVQVKDFVPFTLAGTVDPNDSSKVQSQAIAFQFTPLREGCDVNRKFVLVTNDPNAPPDEVGTPGLGDAAGSLVGRSSQGALVISPPSGNFSRVEQDGEKEIVFTARNISPQDILIDDVVLEIARDPLSGNSQEGVEYFRILEVSQCGNVKDASAVDTVVKKSSGKPEEEYCEDRLRMKVRYKPSTPGRHYATLKLNHSTSSQLYTTHGLSGNSLPVLKTYPPAVTLGSSEPGICSEDGKICLGSECQPACTTDDHCMTGEKCVDARCSDEDVICAPACGVASRKLAICNEGVATLELGELAIYRSDKKDPAPRDDSLTFPGDLIFTLAGNCSGKNLAPGACCEETVNFRDSRVGGMTGAVIHIPSNDASWGDEMFVELNSYTNGSGRTPFAQIDTPSGISRVRSWVKLDASRSTVGLGGFADIRWELKDIQGNSTLPKGIIDPANPSKNCPAGVNGGQCYRLSADKKELEFWTNDAAGIRYTFQVTFTGDLCTEGWPGSTTETISLQEAE